MTGVAIENPILNSPYSEPKRHFRFDENGITSDVDDSRRASTYFVPIAQPKKKGVQQALDTGWTKERMKENDFINQVRSEVKIWRDSGRVGMTRTTRQLVDHWTDEERERRLFFCQIEALDTAIYLTEIAPKLGRHGAEQTLKLANDEHNPGLYRIALKMATGSGKTVVMAMLIAWQTLNKLADPKDKRFSDAFLIVTPGITIKDRLRVLLPNDPGNYYKELDVVPSLLRPELGKAKIVITNFHAFMRRERGGASSKVTKQLLDTGKTGAFTESEGEMVRRVLRELGNKKNIVVLNDEAHHCYRAKPSEKKETEKLSADQKREAKQSDEDARIWISGIEAVKRKIGVKIIYDLSATPFFLRGSGYGEGTLFPWVVSDFSLIDAIESGIVKVPRVPVEDDSMRGESPTYRDIWVHVRDELPKKGWTPASAGKDPVLPHELEGALLTLYGNYEKRYQAWKKAFADHPDSTPPVFIVVCSNTSVSKLVFDYIVGWEKARADGSTVLIPGKLDLFSNVDRDRWTARPNTILVDSHQLESGEAMSDTFKKLAATQIEEFKAEYRERFPGRDVEQLTDEDLLREVMNTVGKPGRLGEHVRCVVSVAMLTEGWDANTVTHILGVRAFSTQLLCEQVVGRGLRRISYEVNEEGMFDPEYAEVYGVPFSFIPGGGNGEPKPTKPVMRVRALEERIEKEVTYPRLMGYRWEMPPDQLDATFDDTSKLAITTETLPMSTESAPIAGVSSIDTLEDLKKLRMRQIAFAIANDVLDRYFRDDDGNDRPYLFPQVLRIVLRWIDECLVCASDCFPQLLNLTRYRYDAADKIHKAIAHSPGLEPLLKPRLHGYEPTGSSRYVDFDTTKSTWPTSEDKCHVSHVVGDSGWELKAAQVLDGMPEVDAYVKNHGLGFTIPYAIDGDERSYIPDFIVRLDDGTVGDDGSPQYLNMVLEVSGQNLRDKKAKVDTTRDLWIPAVNNHGAFGEWFFLEISNPHDDLAETITAKMKEARADLSARFEDRRALQPVSAGKES
ncbi:MAG: restriction endonuclease subunit R [Actinobacteria bacterium]|nr:restriction endonuclease subunit R [Actinomycetota bacterium]